MSDSHPLGQLSRYADLIPDWPAFSEAVQQPLPQTLWRNPSRASAAMLEAWLDAHGLSYQPLAFSPLAYQLPAKAPLGRILPWQAGWFHVQELVSMLAAPLLAPQPGERVLDLCAAPGGKTAMLAALMANQGLLVANDLSIDRIKALRGNLARLGVLNVLCTISDARHLPAGLGMFDRVLADVPCSCEGTMRRNPRVMHKHHQRDKLCQSQAAILAQGLAHLKVGGRLLYSTCTFAPEENEAIVDQALSAHPGQLRLLPIELPGLAHSQGLTHYQGLRFDASLELAWRLYPHQNNSGGFFLALLEKLA